MSSLFIERGEIASHVESAAPVETNVFKAKLFWLAKVPLKLGESYRLRLQTRDVNVVVESIVSVYDAEQLHGASQATSSNATTSPK